MRFTFHDPCGGGNSNSCRDVMVGQGIFDENTVKAFQAALQEHRKNGNGVSRIIFSSPGGSLAAGIALGREIRRLQFDTEVASSIDEGIRVTDGYDLRPLLRNAKCLSACAYAFLGGVRRAVSSDNTLGVHQFRSEGRASHESETQLLTAVLSRYVEDMGVSQRFMTIASMTRPAEIAYISRSVAKNLQIDNSQIALSEWSIQASKNGDPFLTVLQNLDQSKELKLALVSKNSQVFLFAVTSFNRDFHQVKRIGDGIKNVKPIITFVIDGQRYKGQSVENYRINVNSKVLEVESISIFDFSLLEALKQAKKLTIYDDFPRAFSDGSINTDISTKGLSNGVALLARGK